MKTSITIRTIICLLFLLPLLQLSAQIKDYASVKEKIYIQSNHVFFKPGEQLFFKLYLVNAQDQTPSKQSGIAYVEMINPAGAVIQKMKLKVTNGSSEGSYDFSEQASGGVYKIKAYTTWMQNENDSSFFVKEITLQKVIAPRILMKLDFPKKGYGAGDEVNADFSIRNLNDQPISNYQAKFTVSIGGSNVETSNFKTNSVGKAVVNFKLPANLATNDGLLNVTVNYDSYTEAISRSIPIVLNKIDLQFMPEAGTLVNGLATNIAFKAVNENGKAADIKGEVWDNLGNKITSFESYHFGMGKFLFTPREGKTYTAKIIAPANIKQEYKLPKASADGMVMNFYRDGNDLLIRLTATHKMPVMLIGKSKDVAYYSMEINLKNEEKTIRIDPKLFPAGIAQFTAYSSGMPLAERLVFMNEKSILNVSITPDKNKYLPREKVKLTLKTADENGKPVPADFSFSVVDDKLWTFADDKQDHILSWLLMSSELKGKVEEPQFYFKKEEPKAMPALDLVMMTNGYRYFDYIQYVTNENKLKFGIDGINLLSGVVVNKKDRPTKAKVFLVDTYRPDKKVLQVQTNEEGQFCFTNLVPGNNYYMVAQSLRKRETIKIKVTQNGTGFSPATVAAFQVKRAQEKDKFFAVDPNKNPFNKMAADLKADDGLAKKERGVGFNQQLVKQNQLDEVVVTGFGAMRKKDVTGSVTTIRAEEIGFANNINNALAGKVAGVQVMQMANPGAAPVIRLRGEATLSAANAPLFIVNGIPMENLGPGFNVNDIDYVEVIKGATASAIYGARATNGVILIQSKKWSASNLGININAKNYYATTSVQLNSENFTAAKKFYAPQYYSLQAPERNDFRETIYWNPTVQTDANGEATVEFYNSDASTTFRAIAEGIGHNGLLGRAESTYAVENAMSVDAKIPPYLTVGDKALIPLVIKNNSTESLLASINVTSPQNVKLGNYNNAVVLEPGKSMQVLIPLEATAAMKGDIRFVVGNQFGTENISLPISATDKGFPVIETFSGNKSTSYDFSIGKIIPGTMKANLKVFSSLEGQLLDGIESMLREPGGCFEQTSSSLYPNIYVLKYLRESGKSNPEIEKKAMGYIENGYKRLLGFETSKHGFEWFGHTPPHEALTAYGLLEFTDMQQFVNVDKEMLARTKKFLMDRRDGKGEFQLASGGYDRFASVPNKIANIYIVYALTQAGIGKEIQLEYETAVKKAIESNDGYQLSMMALAANNMKNEKDFAQLMDLLHTQYLKTKLASETSVVNSRDASLRVETMSLYALALLRSKTPDVGLVADLISKILAEKSYYGYGSTQATVMALNAVVEYAKLAGKMSADCKINFTMNQKSITTGLLTDNLKEGANSFSVQYNKEKETIPFNLEVTYNTFTPPNSARAELKLSTKLSAEKIKTGETVRMEIEVTNEKNMLQPMAIAKIGIPAGLSSQPWQLKELMEKNQVAYYEIFDNYLVLYWMGFANNETKKINLDLKAEVPGTYKAKSGNTYLYYTPEYKNWSDGPSIEVLP
ncbi:MAG: TonB-dependent receptor plug domain-containing protein [Ferruginibacter sp.]